MNAKRDLLTKEQRQRCIKEIIAFFHDERGEEIGIIAAGKIVDAFHAIGLEIYTKGVADARKLLKEKLEDLELDLDILAGT